MDIKSILGESFKEGMTTEELISALENSDALKKAESAEKELEKTKVALTKSNAEAADFKRQLREKMSAEELKAKEESEELAKLREERDNALRQVTLTSYEKEFLGLGYDSKLATETAEAMVKGDMQTVFRNHKAQLEKVTQDTKTALLKATPAMNGTGSHSDTVTQEQFDKMTYSERVEFKHNNPEEFKKLNES